MSDVKPIPEGFRTLTPHLVVDGAGAAIDFYMEAFGATEIMRMPAPDGRLMHAEIDINGCRMMLADEFPEFSPRRSPGALGGTTVTLHLYVEDVDGAIDRAAAAGATVTMPAADMFWGDRYGKVQDAWGHEWGIATHVADVSPEDCAKAGEAFFSGDAASEAD